MSKTAKFALILSILASATLAALVMLTAMSKKAWAQFDVSKIVNASQTLMLYDGDSQLITGVHGIENRHVIELSQMSPYVVDALISTEDIRFYEHSGIDVRRILGALVADIKSWSLKEGASTITQQLVKLSHLTPDKTLSRKINEALLAVELENHYSKDEILEMYLNYVYFGSGAYGIQAASNEYFGKDAKDLSISEAAVLIATLKAPSRYAPHVNQEQSLKRRNLIINNMKDSAFITAVQHKEAISQPITLNMPTTDNYPYGFYTEYAMEEAMSLLNISREQLLSGGYRIYTALDPSMQKTAEALFADEANFTTPVGDEICQGALCVINPHSFEIVTLIGGRNHDVKLGLNRAAQLHRQPGSAIKPIMVYAPALENGYTAASLLIDEPQDFNGYKPKNFGDTYNGAVTMRTAIAKSLNVPAVKMLSEMSIEKGQSFAKSVGIKFDKKDAGLTLALGGFTYGVTPIELCSAYSAIAAGGKYSPSSCIKYITDAKGKMIYQRMDYPQTVMSAENAFILTSMLQSVVSDGTGKRMNIGIPLAAKTGTTGLVETGGNKDAWVVAYNPDYVATVWMGFDDTSHDRSLPSNATGGTYPSELIAKLFSEKYKDLVAPDFIKPNGVVEVRLDEYSLTNRNKLLLASAFTPLSQVRTEYFTRETAPQLSTDYWVMPTPPTDFKVSANSDGLPVITFTPKEKFAQYKLYRKTNDQTELIATFKGDRSKITHTDKSCKYYVPYEYYVEPIHGQMKVGSREVKGNSTIRIPFTAQRKTFLDFFSQPTPTPTQIYQSPLESPLPSPTEAGQLMPYIGY